MDVHRLIGNNLIMAISPMWCAVLNRSTAHNQGCSSASVLFIGEYTKLYAWTYSVCRGLMAPNMLRLRNAAPEMFV